jgi:hypothetical protein
VNEAIRVDKLRFRIEPIWIIHWNELERENQTFDYLASRIIVPLYETWDNRCIKITTTLLDPYPTKVNINDEIELIDRYFRLFIILSGWYSSMECSILYRKFQRM